MGRASRRGIAALAALALGSACASPPPEAGGKARRTVILSTRYDDARAGAEASQDVAAQLGLLDDPALDAYVSSIGRKLLRGVPRRGFDYRFRVIDRTEPNAFALPGGYVFVSRGLLALANDEDELACVLGHEIVHAAKRHAAAREALARSQNPLAMPWSRAAQLAAYSRDMERDADEVGQRLCAAAGYDPMGLSTFLRSLEQLELLRKGYSHPAGFLDTHPGSRERAGATAARASEIRWRRDPGLGDPREALLAHVEGLALGDRPEAGVFQGDTFVQPVLDFQIRFPSGWEQVNTPQAVGAIAPRGEALVYLVADRPLGDPRQMAEAWLEDARREQPIDVRESRPVKVGALDAWRMRLELATPGGRVSSYVTFVPYDANTFRITGMARAIAAARTLGRTLNTARSFGPMTDAQRQSLRVTRLALVTARAGEGLEALSRRSGNAWDVATTAVYNGVFVNHVYRGGERVKIARETPYVPGAG